MSIPIIFDTDPGVDDAQAIAIIMADPEIEVVGLTTTFGNVHIDTATRNALLLSELAGHDIPVAQGAAAPLLKKPFPVPDWIHGADGLGNQELPEVTGRAVDKTAAEFIIDETRKRPGEITLVAVGPLGNLATALQLDPSVKDRVKQVVIMGGSVAKGGNVTPVAEANMFSDPHAAARVLTAGWPLTMVGLDVTLKTVIEPERMKRIAARQGKLGPLLQHSYDFYAEFYRNAIQLDGCCPHDSVAVTWLRRPDLFKTQRGYLSVVTEGPAEGQIIFAAEDRPTPDQRWQQGGLVDVCVDVDGKAAVDWMESVLVS